LDLSVGVGDCAVYRAAGGRASGRLDIEHPFGMMLGKEAL